MILHKLGQKASFWPDPESSREIVAAIQQPGTRTERRKRRPRPRKTVSSSATLVLILRGFCDFFPLPPWPANCFIGGREGAYENSVQGEVQGAGRKERLVTGACRRLRRRRVLSPPRQAAAQLRADRPRRILPGVPGRVFRAQDGAFPQESGQRQAVEILSNPSGGRRDRPRCRA